MSGPPKLRLIEGEPEKAALDPSDDNLMLAAANNDQRAFAILVERHERSLRRFLWSITNDEAAARDLAQETMLKLWVTRERYRAEGRFKAWLYTLARNAARSMMRKRAVRRFIGLEEQPVLSISPAETLLEKEQTDGITTALSRLPEKFRTPLLLRYVEELEYDDIARVIGRTPSAARSRVHYALKALKALLPEEVRT
jgi:RNA polymerase sigma-70 factor (ECF subfamily)